jgi:hypothetical protein
LCGSQCGGIKVRKDRYRKSEQTNNFLGIYGGLVSMCLGMSGKRRERIASRMEQAPRRLALGGLARESPMSPVPIPLALGRAASSRAGVHPATALSSDLGRAAWRARSGSSAAFASIRLSDPGQAEALHHRYADFWLVDGELELNAPTFGPALPRTRQRRKPANAG